MKVTIRRIVEGRVEKAMQFEYEPYDILIGIADFAPGWYDLVTNNRRWKVGYST